MFITNGHYTYFFFCDTKFLHTFRPSNDKQHFSSFSKIFSTLHTMEGGGFPDTSTLISIASPSVIVRFAKLLKRVGAWCGGSSVQTVKDERKIYCSLKKKKKYASQNSIIK